MKNLVDKSNKMYQQVQTNMVSISQKLHDEHSMWQGRLAELNSMSKNCFSNEWACQRNAVQQQLNKSSAMDDQLQDMSRGIEGMNYELADRVKSAKKDMSVARKLNEQSKESANRYLVKLKIKKDERACLKDELTRVLKAHQSEDLSLASTV
jgi:hypothetical protein